MSTTAYTLVAKTFHGLESVLEQELKDLGMQQIRPLKRAVEFEGNLEDLYRANLHLRTALRVLINISRFNARNEDQLYRQVQKIDWQQYLSVNGTFAVDSSVRSEYFNHSKYAALRVKDAIVDQFRKKVGKRPSIDLDRPTVRVHLQISGTSCILSIDSSGDALFKRGYREDGRLAPLNEVLAAGMIMAAGWDGKTTFYDPMCGSGTLLTEAALIGSSTPSGWKRKHFGFMQWNNYDRDLWNNIREVAAEQIHPIEAKMFGGDLTGRALGGTRSNLMSAGFIGAVKLNAGAFQRQSPPAGEGLIVTNPPYGERLKPEDINGLYSEIGDTLKQKYAGWSAWVISSNIAALKQVGLRPSRKMTLFNGQLECRFHRYDLYSGSKKNRQED